MPFAQRVAALFAVTVLATGALTAATTPRAARAAATDRPTSVLLLTVLPHVHGEPRAAALRCHPAGGTHPAATTACQAVAAVHGDLGAMTPEPGPCTLEYAPVTARALGFWQGRPVSWAKTFGNRCALLRETGSLFAF
ncbi:SSI family serine proteinase inhibitor [Micromonospora sp. C28SCA-DRY-2]|uniref:SSI family serine proteinase inhibitor n=1 Tax=Micromonospora sp. C28SCA-DRY-2 TaxID=3059522 RepID=UPI002675CC9E|nr:SSI family serine proteinase inhibitor [Micromonospora sp. C28SCA-DRY-2]MDO3704957.1 SSI family serine proteinase inhibitor [Micromonospora sp. C28SCA-DRY-2]